MNTTTDPLVDVYAAGAAYIETAIGVELERVAGFVRDAEIPAVVPQSYPRIVSDSAPAGDGGNDSIIQSGGHSDAWWWGVALCEQGGENDEFFGFFSYMDGSAAGLTWEQQVAKGNATLAEAGREIGPWAAACVARGYQESPSG